MASSAGTVATEPPSSAHAVLSSASPSDDLAKSLKRPREHESASPRSLQHTGILGSPMKQARLALASAQAHAAAPAPLTGVAALEDERRLREAEARAAISDNPSHRALASLMSSAETTMSRPTDAPQLAPPAAMDTDPRPTDVTSLVHANDEQGHNQSQHGGSPRSTTSMVGGHVTGSPTPMDIDGKVGTPQQMHEDRSQLMHESRPQPGSMSYPGSLHASMLTETPSRGMSFPMPGSQASPASGTKKHKCQYCNTEFTRHHNLKSHLLTHSQEKPYVCTDCDMRFRRLHDLKRHGKLHTGEKPHVCPKCDRKFARGDALARHSKGPAGCVGRQGTMDDFDRLGREDSLLAAAIAAGKSDAELDELRRQSLPSISAQQAEGEHYGQTSRSYPPAGPRSSGGLFPPIMGPAASSTTNSMASAHTPTSSGPISGGTTATFPPGGMVESPKPLTPGETPVQDPMARPRSPSSMQYARRPSEISSPGGQSRSKQTGLSHPSYAPPTAIPNRSVEGASTNDSNNMFAQDAGAVWGYIQQLQEEVKWLTGKMESHEREIANLQLQLEERDHSFTEADAAAAAAAAAAARAVESHVAAQEE